MSFDTSIFALHLSPLAAYVEPGGYQLLQGMSAPQEKSYAKRVPATYQVACAILQGLPQRNKWGKQIVDADGSHWVTECKGVWRESKDGKRRWPGKELRLVDVLGSLSRPDRYALGRTDMLVLSPEHPEKRIRLCHSLVDCLCLDVDMPDAWERAHLSPIRYEIQLEREIACAMGFSVYRCFRTGSKGHQVVLPLPTAIPRSCAGWILWAYRSILDHYQARNGIKRPDGSGGSDVSNLSSIVRIPGGRHVKNGNLALWIEPDACELYQVADQVELMRSGYQRPAVSPLASEAFEDAADEVADYLRHKNIAPDEYPRGKLREMHYPRIADALSDNIIVCRYLDVKDMFPPPLWAFPDLPDLVCAGSSPRNKEDSSEQIVRVSRFLTEMSPEERVKWANEVLVMDWGEGSFWGWISEGGHRAITAAKVLHGDKALGVLLDIAANNENYKTPGEPREWNRVIRSLYEGHNRPNLVSEEVLLTRREAQLVDEIVEQCHNRRRIQPRNRSDIKHVIHVLLAAFKESETGSISLSYRAIAEKINRLWPDERIDHVSVRRIIQTRLGLNNSEGFALVEEMFVDQTGQKMALRYRPGSELCSTWFGERLPCLEVPAESPVVRDLYFRVRSLSGIRNVHYSSVKIPNPSWDDEEEQFT